MYSIPDRNRRFVGEYSKSIVTTDTRRTTNSGIGMFRSFGTLSWDQFSCLLQNSMQKALTSKPSVIW